MPCKFAFKIKICHFVFDHNPLFSIIFQRRNQIKKQKCSTQHCVLSTIPCKTKVCIVDISYQKITQAIQETILPATAKKSKRGPESSWRESLFIVQFRDLCWLRHQASTLYIKVNLTCDTLRINPNPLKSSIEKELKSEELSFSCIRYFWRLGLRKKIYYLHYRRFYMPSWFN